ncbi:PepSY-associated TM helix domain-containing protein [Galbibacter marinus]|uniref:PepSY-associated TM helix domain-containing protein n=1 Tax=Galbibacter marinus TaxID=555500 RepID=K2Q2C8_9FLAO|nr:PepSY-associated TM helix domain-containing protein [Galbibacter marinus]EKF55021.1 PepSY-associated TM helix domain-containing protein [Galbibacter marinus]
MSNRIYNIIFHTHTLSGIIISALLYVIFFTGSISFLRDEINAWERNEPIEEHYFSTIDFDTAIQNLDFKEKLYSKDLSFSHRYYEKRIAAFVSKAKDTTLKEENTKTRRRGFFYLDAEKNIKSDYTSNYSMGEFFYRLHFFAQLNFFGRSGYFLSGMVALFFLFAVVTGVIIHWKKIIPSFYVFRPKAKWKTIWTDSHVALGLIGLPYQFMFAVTGAFLIIGYTVMLPPVQKVLYNDNPKELTQAAQDREQEEYPFIGEAADYKVSYNELINRTKDKWPELVINELKVINYGDKNMHVQVGGSPKYKDKISGAGHLTYRLSDMSVVAIKDPYKTSYVESADHILRRLHYGDYGGYGMKLIYLVLGFITCFVIISGVLIWLVARDKKHVASYKRRFNSWLVRIYMAVCLGLFPVTAATFSAVKLFATDTMLDRKAFISQTFFWTWLVVTILLLFKKDHYTINKLCLIWGGILSFLVPISQGYVTGNWVWTSISKGYSQLVVVDLFWIILALVSLGVLLKLKKKPVHP